MFRVGQSLGVPSDEAVCCCFYVGEFLGHCFLEDVRGNFIFFEDVYTFACIKFWGGFLAQEILDCLVKGQTRDLKFRF